MTVFNCKHCGKEVKKYGKPRLGSVYRFCTSKCYWDSMREKHFCKTCGREFKRTSHGKPVYCSDDCKKDGEWGKINKTINLGRKHTEEFKIKQSKRSKESGKWKVLFKPEVRAKAMKNATETRRKDSAFWFGGIDIGSLRRRIRLTLEYEKWRTAILERDSYTCQKCGTVGIQLDVDHIKSFTQILVENSIFNMDTAIACPEVWDINNGRTLCRECHMKTETWGYHKLGTKFIQKVEKTQ